MTMCANFGFDITYKRLIIIAPILVPRPRQYYQSLQSYPIFRAFLPLAHVVRFVICCNGPHHLDLPPLHKLAKHQRNRTNRLAFPPLPAVALNYSIITVTTAAVIRLCPTPTCPIIWHPQLSSSQWEEVAGIPPPRTLPCRACGARVPEASPSWGGKRRCGVSGATSCPASSSSSSRLCCCRYPPPPASAHAPVNLDKRMVQEPDKRQPDVRWVRDAPCRF